MDIGALRDLLRAIRSEIDYRNLDEHPAFRGRLSTTERVAQYVADRAAERIAGLGTDAAPVAGSSVRIVARESPVAYAAYERAVG